MNTQFMLHAAQVVEEGVITGHDWPNTQDELNRLNAARRLREGAAEIGNQRATINQFHHAVKDAGWHPGRTDDDLCEIIKAKGRDMEKLNGERAVLVRLLRAADNVLDTLDPESDAESEGLAALRQAIAAAAQHQAG